MANAQQLANNLTLTNKIKETKRRKKPEKSLVKKGREKRLRKFTPAIRMHQKTKTPKRYLGEEEMIDG
jgi:hypothetical protein